MIALALVPELSREGHAVTCAAVDHRALDAAASAATDIGEAHVIDQWHIVVARFNWDAIASDAKVNGSAHLAEVNVLEEDIADIATSAHARLDIDATLPS